MSQNLMPIPSEVDRLTSLLATASIVAQQIANNHWQIETPLPETVAVNLQAKLDEIGASLAQARKWVKSEAEPRNGQPAIVMPIFDSINHHEVENDPGAGPSA